ncbi:prepilin-type N-terminal cleavage/methylation domain-containing protein [Geomonas sp. Red32]|uniref:prepilin-type N-terminal cleavage/methylation domain-containing protein n=1 Tax=Geomonas sp. Red32 TaxID=2912856 RepID=UPI00202D0861|nr:prepilin-type N-terminal cleavage/methylation domain-containing protein [Geomonas sp. Red32]MCM0080127.1 prepilin-type N-terminal cleavage/methylation domain-containing protein [Geomonas sp. Red32]
MVRYQAGFTLIEMVVVILIVALAAAVVVPRLPAPEGTRLKNSARNLASGIRFLNDQAIVTKGIYRLHLNISESTTSIAKLSSGGEEGAPDDNFMGRRLIEEGITIEDVLVPQLGKVSEGEVVLPFGPGGYSDCIVVHLKGGEEHYTVIAYPSGGKVQVLEGYKSLDGEVVS